MTWTQIGDELIDETGRWHIARFADHRGMTYVLYDWLPPCDCLPIMIARCRNSTEAKALCH